MTLLAFAVFGCAFGVAAYAMFATVLPSLERIGDALAGRPQAQFAPLLSLVQAERTIAVRRWATTAPRATAPLRAAA